MTALTGIKAISFDVDGTIWDFVGMMRSSLVTRPCGSWRGTTRRLPR